MTDAYFLCDFLHVVTKYNFALKNDSKTRVARISNHLSRWSSLESAKGFHLCYFVSTLINLSVFFLFIPLGNVLANEYNCCLVPYPRVGDSPGEHDECINTQLEETKLTDYF